MHHSRVIRDCAKVIASTAAECASQMNPNELRYFVPRKEVRDSVLHGIESMNPMHVRELFSWVAYTAMFKLLVLHDERRLGGEDAAAHVIASVEEVSATGTPDDLHDLLAEAMFSIGEQPPMADPSSFDSPIS
ncbi:MAG: hypothetical protein AMXMBFR58_20250 [Phycisphaerae bacterium]